MESRMKEKGDQMENLRMFYAEIKLWSGGAIKKDGWQLRLFKGLKKVSNLTKVWLANIFF